MNTWLHIHDSMEAATKTNKQTNLLLPRNSTILRTPFFIDDCNTPYRHILTSICLSQPPSCKLKKIIGFLFPPSLKFRLEFNFQAWNFYKFLCLCFLQYVVPFFSLALKLSKSVVSSTLKWPYVGLEISLICFICKKRCCRLLSLAAPSLTGHSKDFRGREGLCLWAFVEPPKKLESL